MHKVIRLATEDDAAAILKIYEPYITNTAITFECKVPTITEFRERMNRIQKNYPWLVCEINGELVGYAYASPVGEREAYDWSVQLSVYVAPEYHRRHIGKAFYFAIIELLRLQGFYNVYAIVTLPNIKSESFHEALGFKTIGVFPNIGYKLGSWRDVKWYELKIKEHIQSPEKPKPISEISNSKEFKAIITEAEQMIKD